MFYTPHGITKKVENTDYQFDAKTYQWKIISETSHEFSQSVLKDKEVDQEWFDNNCHPEGVFKCNRCYRKHFVPDNFDLLCDGCSLILKDYHSQGHSFEFTERFNEWYTNVPTDVVQARISLRMSLDACYKTDSLWYQNQEVIILRDPLKNNGNLEVMYTTDDIKDKNKRFIVNCFDLEIRE